MWAKMTPWNMCKDEDRIIELTQTQKVSKYEDTGSEQIHGHRK
jgi:hypothetical protein